MAYAVVTFNDNEVSEVSSNWLEKNDDESSCWWLANCKNVSTLISKRSEPDKKSWDNLPVTIEKFCNTHTSLLLLLTFIDPLKVTNLYTLLIANLLNTNLHLCTYN